MRLNTLRISNLRSYSSEVQFDFRVPDASRIITLVGENGSGKTSVLHAIRWVLYGRSQDGTKNISTVELVNRGVLQSSLDKNLKPIMEVELDWTVNDVDYKLIRTATFSSSSHFEESFLLRKLDGEYFSSSKAKDIIRQFLPEEISHLFLFDGESLDKFSNMNTYGPEAEFMQKQIENTLSIPHLDKARKWISTQLGEETTKAEKEDKESAKIQGLKKDIEELRIKQTEYAGLLEEARGKFQSHKLLADHTSGMLGDLDEFQRLVSEQKSFESELNKIDIRISELRLESLEMLEEFPWLPISSELRKISSSILMEAANADKAANNISSLKNRVQMLRDTLEDKKCSLCGGEKAVEEKSILDQIKSLEREMDGLEVPDQSSISRNLVILNAIGFNESASSRFGKVLENISEKSSEIVALKIELSQIETELLRFPGDQNHQQLLDEYRNDVKLQNHWNNVFVDLSKESEEVDAELNSKQKSLSNTKGVSKEKRMALNGYRQIEEIFKSALEAYIDLARQSVQQKTSETFLKIIPNLGFTGVEISSTYGARITDSQGDVPLPNQGSKVALAISLCDGLLRTTMPAGEGFVIMDSPVASLDGPNRENFFKWAASSKLRLSLLMIDTEYNDTVDRNYLGSALGRSYIFQKREGNNPTVVKEGK
jgi:DNA sulfur modification protein DndD